MRSRGKWTVLTALALMLCGGALSSAATAWGQYFGANKVRYQDFDFLVLRTENFNIHYYEEARAAIDIAAVLAERWRTRLGQVLDHELDTQTLILYAGHPHFRQTNATPGEIGEGTGGFTDMFKRRVVQPFAGPMAETDHVLGHEIVHAFQFAIAGEGQRGRQASRSAAMRLPLWFIEGMAEYLSLGSQDAHTSMWMRDAVLHDNLPTVQRLNRPAYFPYRFGHSFWAYVAGRWGDEVIGPLLRLAGQRGDIAAAVRSVLDVSLDELSEGWHEALRAEYAPVLERARPAADSGRVLLEAGNPRGRLNVSPSLSPDGTRLAFFSERDIFSIELYLLDVETGQVIRRLTRTATDPHFDTLQFLSSAGTWSPDGSRFALAGVSFGRPVITVLDAASGAILEEHLFADLVEIFHPSWSPDGRHIAFSANVGGLSDLYLLDLETGERRRLTEDAFAALQPSWSPDGRELVYVTDRFTSNLDTLIFGGYRLARMDPFNGGITELPSLSGGKNFNPQWSQSGEIYFLSDARGTNNLYRLDPVSGSIEELSDLQTGISGISPLSPAMSVAPGRPGEPDLVAVSIFLEGRYHLYLLEDLDEHARPVDPAIDPERLAVLPPRERTRPIVDPLLHTPVIEAEDITVETIDPYRARLGLDFVSELTLMASGGAEGTSFGGGVAMMWSDMLGDHNLLTLAEIDTQGDTFFRDLAAVVAYENRENRWGWGASVGQIPMRSNFFSAQLGVIDGEPSEIIRERRQWQINREAGGRIMYPFSRAQRLEFGGGYRNIQFIQDERTRVYSLRTGRLTADQTQSLPAPSTLNLGTASTALVFDTAVWGGNGPIMGRRYRFELGASLGDLNYVAPLADFRQYHQVAQYLSLAARALHTGRYGGDGEDPRLGPMFLGNPALVRGYSSQSFNARECNPPPGAPQTCPVFDQLFGSRLALINAEARVPLLGPLGLLESPWFPPFDAVMFYDTGVAWTSDERANFLGGDRSLVSSYGAGMRLNLLGALTMTLNYVYPVDRPDKGWHWEFSLTTGF